MSSLQKYLEDLKKGRNVEKAAEALGIEGDPVAIDPLIERLVERVENPGRDPLAVQKLSEALGKLKAKKAVPTLLRLMDTANAPETFNKAVRALGRIGDSRAIDPLLKQLLEGSSIAAWVLGEFGAKRTVEPLIKALSDSDFKTRGNAAHALGVLGNKKAIEPLKSVLTDNEKWVRENALEALAKMGVSNEWVLEWFNTEKEGQRVIKNGLIDREMLKRMYGRGVYKVLPPLEGRINPENEQIVLLGGKVYCGVCSPEFTLPNPLKLSLLGPQDSSSYHECICTNCQSVNSIQGYTTKSPDDRHEYWLILKLLSIPAKFQNSPYIGWPTLEAEKVIKVPIGLEAKKSAIEIEGDSLDEVREQIKDRISEGYYLLSEKIISEGKRETFKAVEAFNEYKAEDNAKKETLTRYGQEAKIEEVKLAVEGKKGFLGIGKKPSQYEVSIYIPAKIIAEVVTFQTK